MVTHVFYVAGFGDKCEWIEGTSLICLLLLAGRSDIFNCICPALPYDATFSLFLFYLSLFFYVLIDTNTFHNSFPQVSCREHEILSLGLTQQGLGCDGNVAMRLVIFGYLVIIISQYSILQTIHENPSTEQAAIDSICLPVFVL